MDRLRGKVALVTGAGGAIGTAVAVALAREGATVVATDIDGAAAAQTASAVESMGGMSLALEHDVSRAESWLRVTAETQEISNRINILHNNAAALDDIAKDRDVLNVSLELWNHTLAVNLTGVMLGCKHIIPAMMENGGGSIINTSSTAAITGHSILPAYSASKAALHALTRSVATTFGKRGIRCNTIAPGWIRSPRNERGTTRTTRRVLPKPLSHTQARRTARYCGGSRFSRLRGIQLHYGATTRYRRWFHHA